jgi:glycosyltransferase involved in cell wall biosynthesis
MAVASRKPAGGRNPESSASAAARRQLVLITHARYPTGEPRAERAAKAARDAGYRVQVIALRQPGEPPRELVDGVQVLRLRIRHVRGAGALRIALEYISFTVLATAATIALRRRVPVHVVEVHAPPPFLIIAGILPRLLGAKLLLDIRDLSPHLWNARFAGRPATRLAERILWAMERLACTISDRVITVHEPYRSEIVRHGVSATKVAVVMNTPDEALLMQIPPALVTSRQNGSFTVAYHGTITEWYAVDLLIRAIAEVRASIDLDLRGVILGEGDRLPLVRELADDLGVGERVFFSSRYLPMAEALQIVSHADAGVVPNRPSEINRFILPNKLFEYVALGIPVVVPHLETIVAHFDPDEVNFFEPGNVCSLAGAIRSIAAYPHEAARKAMRAKLRMDAYSWRGNRDHYLAVLEEPRALSSSSSGLRLEAPESPRRAIRDANARRTS